MNLLLSLRSEIQKTKRTASPYFTVITAIVVSILFVLTVLANNNSGTMENPWTAIYREEFKSLNLLVLPFFTILVCTLLPQIEYRSHTWKQVLASPQDKRMIYLAKFFTIQIMLLAFLFLFLLCTAITGCLLQLFTNKTSITQPAFDWSYVLKYGARTYLSILAMSVIQFVAGITMKNFMAPIALGFILWLLGGLLIFEMHSSFARFYPYSFSTMAVFSQYDSSFPAIEWTSIVMSFVFILVGYRMFTRIKAG